VVKEKQIPFLEFNDLKIQRLQHSTESTASALVLNNLDKRNSKEAKFNNIYKQVRVWVHFPSVSLSLWRAH